MGYVVFGLNNVDKVSIDKAIEAGYKIFDSSTEYRIAGEEAAKYLYDAIPAGERRNYRLIHKIEGDLSEAQVKAIADTYKECLFCVMPHHTEPNLYDVLKTHMQKIAPNVLVGASNVKDVMGYYEKGCRHFELNIDTILEKDVYIDLMDCGDSTLYVYGLIGMAKKIKCSLTIEEVLYGITKYLKETLTNVTIIPILSSKTEEKICRNLEIYQNEEQYNGKDFKVINQYLKSIPLSAKNIRELDKDLAQTLYAISQKEIAVREAELMRLEGEECEKTRYKENYRSDENYRTFSIEDLIRMLKQEQTTCDYVDAYNFLTERLILET